MTTKIYDTTFFYAIVLSSPLFCLDYTLYVKLMISASRVSYNFYLPTLIFHSRT